MNRTFHNSIGTAISNVNVKRYSQHVYDENTGRIGIMEFSESMKRKIDKIGSIVADISDNEVSVFQDKQIMIIKNGNNIQSTIK